MLPTHLKKKYVQSLSALVLNPAWISDNYQEYMYSFFISLYDASESVSFGITNHQISEEKK
jgi:hypothetical protein